MENVWCSQSAWLVLCIILCCSFDDKCGWDVKKVYNVFIYAHYHCVLPDKIISVLEFIIASFTLVHEYNFKFSFFLRLMTCAALYLWKEHRPCAGLYQTETLCIELRLMGTAFTPHIGMTSKESPGCEICEKKQREEDRQKEKNNHGFWECNHNVPQAKKKTLNPVINVWVVSNF